MKMIIISVKKNPAHFTRININRYDKKNTFNHSRLQYWWKFTFAYNEISKTSIIVQKRV